MRDWPTCYRINDNARFKMRVAYASNMKTFGRGYCTTEADYVRRFAKYYRSRGRQWVTVRVQVHRTKERHLLRSYRIRFSGGF